MPASKKDLKPRARSRYAAGLSLEEIAAELGVSVSTISRWKSADERGGRSWNLAPAPDDLGDLQDIIAALIKRLRALAHDDATTTPAWADSLTKLLTGLDKTINLFGDSLQLMIALDRFSQWFEQHLEAEDVVIVRRAMNAYMEEIKETNR